MDEGQRSSEMEVTNINTAADSLDSATIFHVVTDILGFVLFMHQQIPSVLQDITWEFDELRSEYKELEVELGQSELKAASTRRKQAARKREVRMGIKRFEKLMSCILNLKTALQLMIAEVPNVEKICLVLGPSPLRHLHVYELNFAHGRTVLGHFSLSQVAEALCRKAIRTLISRGAGAGANSYAVRAPGSLNFHLHFLVKHETQQNKKMVPYRLWFRSRTQNLEMNALPNNCATSVGLLDSKGDDLICKVAPRGIGSLISQVMLQVPMPSHNQGACLLVGHRLLKNDDSIFT